MTVSTVSPLDRKIGSLAAKYLPLAASIVKEAVRIPADFVDRPPGQGGDPECGLSNHEGPRIEYLRRMIVEHAAVRIPPTPASTPSATWHGRSKTLPTARRERASASSRSTGTAIPFARCARSGTGRSAAASIRTWGFRIRRASIART